MYLSAPWEPTYQICYELPRAMAEVLFIPASPTPIQKKIYICVQTVSRWINISREKKPDFHTIP